MNIIAYSNSMYDSIYADWSDDFFIITNPEDLKEEIFAKHSPQFIFFPHWSHKIPENIFSKYNCVIFHMTDLPFGRGGSPLQNLIIRGIKVTKISAIKCVEELDAGPVYLKKDLDLSGSAADIYMRAAAIIKKMIIHIQSENITPQNQVGEIVKFSRRKPKEGNLENITDIVKIYDHIRMLDAEGYPPAFLETESFLFEFSKAVLSEDHVEAVVHIKLKEFNK